MLSPCQVFPPTSQPTTDSGFNAQGRPLRAIQVRQWDRSLQNLKVGENVDRAGMELAKTFGVYVREQMVPCLVMQKIRPERCVKQKRA